MTFGGPHLIASLSSLLGVRAGMNVSIINAPPGFIEALLPLPEGAALVDTSKLGLDMQVVFSTRKLELVDKLSSSIRGMAVLGSIWACFPTVAEGAQVPTEDFVRLAALEVGLTDVKKVMLGPDWTALRLQRKPRGPRLDLPAATA
jgi:Protein of unknown function (DUF3052)